MAPAGRGFYMAYPQAYLKKIAALCVENNVKLVFIFLPEYASGLWDPLESAVYRKYGEILIPPHAIFENPDY